MKKSIFILLTTILLLGVTACGPAAPPPEPDEASPAPQQNEENAPRPTVTPIPADAEATAVPADDEGYPAPARPTVTPLPEDYPAPDAPAPTRNPYPAQEGYTWVIIPAGEQCADALNFETIDEAIALLNNADIEVHAKTSVNLMVCQACDCPTSLHYRVQILEEDLEAAQSLGWAVDPN